jgi:hypothetical protein
LLSRVDAAEPIEAAELIKVIAKASRASNG